MRFQLSGAGWPCGQFLVPGATILEIELSADGTIVQGPQWNNNPLMLSPLPIETVPLDADAALMLVKWYEPLAAVARSRM